MSTIYDRFRGLHSAHAEQLLTSGVDLTNCGMPSLVTCCASLTVKDSDDLHRISEPSRIPKKVHYLRRSINQVRCAAQTSNWM